MGGGFMVRGMRGADILQNLKDAGRSAERIRRFMKTLEAGAVGGCSRLLDSCRRALLDDVRSQEEKLTCLDYLRCQLRRA